MNRREFLGAAATAAAWSRGTVSRQSPNEIVNVAIVGMRGENHGQPTWTRYGRGMDHYAALSGVKNARITHVVDVDERHFVNVLPELRARWGGNPQTETDIRRLLDNPDVDAITIAAPDHWHALMTIWACQAGKDVYVEKPVCHNLYEGRRMIEAARKYNRVVQAGTQRRSSALMKEAVAFLRSGGLGKIYSARCSVLRPREPIGSKPDGEPPEGVHYDLWLGPAPWRPFNELRFHYTWHWFWDYGDTDLGNNGVHVLDLIRWAIGKNEHPQRISCTGGLYEQDALTDQETPNVQHAAFEYADGNVVRCDVQGWYSGNEGAGSFIHGTEGWMSLDGSDGPRIFLGRKNEPGPDLTKGIGGNQEPGPDPHFQNFIDCVRSRNWHDLAADVEQGYMSSAL